MMEANPETGYLEATEGSWKGTGFTSEKKKIFIKLASDYVREHKSYPPVDELADQLDVSVKTIQAHFRSDPVFKEDWDEIKARLYQVYTKKLDKKVDSKVGVVPNIMMLKFLERGQFSEGLNPISSNSPTKELINRFSDAIDAEIVPESKQLPGSIQADKQPNNQTD